MRSRVAAFGVVAVTVVGAVAWGQQSGQQQQQQRGAVERTTTRESAGAQPEVAPLPPGVATEKVVPRGEMERALVSAADAATRSGGWGDLVRTFVAEDRKTLGTELHEDYTILNNRAEKFREVWGERYGKGAKFDAKGADFGDVRAGAGVVRDPSGLATGWPVKPGEQAGIGGETVGTGETNEVQARAQEPAPPGQRPWRLGSGVPEDKGEMKAGLVVGVLQLPRTKGGLPSVRVSLIKEGDGWRIDVPNYRTESMIRDDLLYQLKELERTRDQWPKDPKEGQRMVVQRVMMAIYGIAPEGSRG